MKLRKIIAFILAFLSFMSILGSFSYAQAESSTVMYCIGSDVNERAENNTRAKSVGTHEKGERVHVVGESDGWFQLTSGNWMSGKYLRTRSEVSDDFAENSFEYMYVRGTDVNERSGPGKSYSVVAIHQPGDRVKVSYVERGWAILTSGNSISTDYLLYSKQEVIQYYLDNHNDIIVVNISDQFSFYSKKGVIIGSADVVTGADETPTPPGFYTVSWKDEDTYLMNDWHVDYITYFVDGIGIHDAYWRNGVFGGIRYHWNGSHGCVNTNLDYAWIVHEYSVEGRTKVLVIS